MKSALNYFIGLLEDGELVPRYHEDTRKEIADALYHLLKKVADLPDDVPENLVQASAVRAIVEAQESYTKFEQADRQEKLTLHMREEEAAASIHGHVLTDWGKLCPVQIWNIRPRVKIVVALFMSVIQVNIIYCLIPVNEFSGCLFVPIICCSNASDFVRVLGCHD